MAATASLGAVLAMILLGSEVVVHAGVALAFNLLGV